jgi:hypothetical protein
MRKKVPPMGNNIDVWCVGAVGNNGHGLPPMPCFVNTNLSCVANSVALSRVVYLSTISVRRDTSIRVFSAFLHVPWTMSFGH